MLASRIKSSTAAIVMMLAAFGPGARCAELRLVERSRNRGPATLNTLGTTVAAIFSIALGTLAGFSVFHTFNRPTQTR